MTATPRLDALTQLRFPDVRWDEHDRPVLIADGRLYRITELDHIVEADEAYVVGVNEKTIDRLTRFLRARRIHLYELRVADLTSLTRLTGLEELAVTWDTKVESVEPLGTMTGLRALSLGDTPKVRDLTPIGRLRDLEVFDFSGGIWNTSVTNSLEPLASLEHLEEVRLTNLRVLDGGLRPLARCRSLRRLVLSNQFQTADYAYLSVALPDTDCEMFAPYIRLGASFGGKDVMVVGSRKPFLDSTKDAARLERYAQAFRALQEQAAAELAG